MAETRRLTTIMALDVAGYSRAAEKDDASAALAVRQLRAVITDICAPFGGRIFNTAGDGFMVEFPAAASGVQAAMALLEEGRSGARPLPNIRIGLHLGDVIVEDSGDLLGHGVNVAARLQALAEPGTAMASETVWQQVRSGAQLPFRAQGKVQLDKMDQRLGVYSLDPEGGVKIGKIGWRRLVRASLALGAIAAALVVGFVGWKVWGPQEGHRIAVMRFINLGDTSATFSDEVGEEIIGELAQIKGLDVTSRASSFALSGADITPANAAQKLGANLILTGSVRRLADSVVRVHVQLVEAPGGKQVWAESLERPQTEMFEMQREIAVRAARAINVRTEPPPANHVDPQAYALYMEGVELLTANAHGDTAAMRDLFLAAVERDPTFGKAWTRLAYTENDLAQEVLMVQSPDKPIPADVYDRALAAADKAIEFEGPRSEAVGLKGTILVFLGRWDEAAELNAQAARNGADGDYCVPYYLGYATEALRFARQLTRDDPLNPRSWIYLEQSCSATGNAACAMEGSRRARELAPEEAYILGYHFYALVEAGQIEAARRLRAQNKPQMEEFLSYNMPIDDRHLSWMTGDGPPVSVEEIEQQVAAGKAFVDPAVDMLGHLKEWDAAAQMLDRWGARERPSLPGLFYPEMAPLRAKPQFWALMEREGLVDFWRKTGRWPDFCARERVCEPQREANLAATKPKAS